MSTPAAAETKDTEENRKDTEENRKDTEENRKDTEEDRKDTEENRKDTEENRKDTEENRKDTEENRKDTEENRKDAEENRKDTEENCSGSKDVNDEETNNKNESRVKKRKLEEEDDNEQKDHSAKRLATDNTKLVQDYYDTLSKQDAGNLDQRNESRILYMRNFNNWTKTMVINEYLAEVKKNKVFGTSLRVLDMCCGKGGDLLKWRRANINHLICADISDLSIEHCKKRYNDMSRRDGPSGLFSAEFITADCTKVRLRENFLDASVELDFVSCQFAFHYCFESLQQAECMLRNASESLKPGGYFIGTMPDANDLVARWQKAEGNKFGNNVYSVDFVCENKEKPPLFGAKYNFHLEGVVDCPEFLVHLPTFCKLALKFGLKLVKFERFDDFYERMKYKGKPLLGRMQALETYPPQRGGTLVGQSASEYEHAAEYVSSRNNTDFVKIGTLSRSEWEVISLYAVFAFQKMKTNWNSEGKPEYEDL